MCVGLFQNSNAIFSKFIPVRESHLLILTLLLLYYITKDSTFFRNALILRGEKSSIGYFIGSFSSSPIKL